MSAGIFCVFMVRSTVLARTILALFLAMMANFAGAADEALRLHAGIGLLMHRAMVEDNLTLRKELLDEARAELVATLARFPSSNSRLSVLVGGRIVPLTPRKIDEQRRQTATSLLAELDVGDLRSALGRSLSPIAKDEFGWTDLHWAAALDLPDLAAGLLDAGADRDAGSFGASNLDSDFAYHNIDYLYSNARLKGVLETMGRSVPILGEGFTPLAIAAMNDSSRVAEILVTNGADIEMSTPWDETPLTLAMDAHAWNVVPILIKGGAYLEALGSTDMSGSTPLAKAVAKNNLEIARLLIDHGAEIDAQYPTVNNPLHVAAKSDSIEFAQLLIERGARIDLPSWQERSPLHQATLNNALGVATLLIDEGADLRHQDEAGNTPLDTALQSDALETALLIMQRRADDYTMREYRAMLETVTKFIFERGRFSSKDIDLLNQAIEVGLDNLADIGGLYAIGDQRSATLLHLAAATNSPTLAATLTRRGADIDAVDSDGIGPIHYAIEHRANDIVTWLIESGADLDLRNENSGETPLHFALKSRAGEIVRQLIEGGADIFAEDASGLSFFAAAWDMAVIQQTYPVDEFVSLLKTIMRVNGQLPSEGDHQELLIHAIASNVTDVVPMLIKSIADMDGFVVSSGLTLLHYAARYDALDVANYLIDLGADIFAADANGLTPLDHALDNKSMLVGGLLVEKGIGAATGPDSIAVVEAVASFTIQDAPIKPKPALLLKRAVTRALEAGFGIDQTYSVEGDDLALLHLAAISNAGDVTSQLIAQGADIFVTNNRGAAPIHFAALANAPDVVAILLENGAGALTRDTAGRTPLDFALDAGSSTTYQILMEQMARDPAKQGMIVLLESVAAFAYTGDEIDALGADLLRRALTLAIESGVDRNSAYSVHDDLSVSLLHLAASSNALDLASQLIEGGADIDFANEGGWTPLHYAVWDRAFDVGSLLVSANADFLTADIDGVTPLEIALSSERPRLVSHMINHAVETDANIDLAGLIETILIQSYENSWDVNRELIADVMQLAVEKGLHRTISYRLDTRQYPPLTHMAVQANLPDIVSQLIAAGAQVYAVDGDGRSALDYAFDATPRPLTIALTLIESGSKYCRGSVFDGCLQWFIDGVLKDRTIDDQDRLVLQRMIAIGVERGANMVADHDIGRRSGSLLHLAARADLPESTALLIEHGAVIGQYDGAERLAIDIALEWNNRDAISAILEASITRLKSGRRTASFLFSDYHDSLEAIFRHGVVDGNRFTPDGAAFMASALNMGFRSGVDIEESIYLGDRISMSLLELVLMTNSYELVSDVIAADDHFFAKLARITDSNETPLVSSAITDHSLGIVVTLMDAIADRFGRNSETQTKEVFKRMVGALINRVRKDLRVDEDESSLLKRVLDIALESEFGVDEIVADGMTPLHLAALADAPDIAAKLLGRGANIHAKDEQGETPLFLAGESGALAIAKDLVERGANIHATDTLGQTALFDAAATNANDVVLYLLGQGAKLRVRDVHRRTALAFAASGKAPDTALTLIAHGADIHDTGGNDRTWLHRAANWDAHKIAGLLIGQGADIHALDNGGRRPLQYAERTGACRVASLLVAVGASRQVNDQMDDIWQAPSSLVSSLERQCPVFR